MSTQKSGFGWLGFSVIGAFGGSIIIFLSMLVNSGDVYLFIVGAPMIFIASKKGIECVFYHALIFLALPLSLLLLGNAIVFPVRLLIFWIVASLAVYHIVVICSRYYHGKKRATELITRR